MKFLIDHCLSPKYAAILGALEYGEVTPLRQEFPHDTKDPTWITEIGARGWTLLSLDRSQLRRPEEIKAIQAGGAIGMYFAKKFASMKLDEQAWRIMKAWPNIARTAALAQKGACYIVAENGRIDPNPL